MLFTFEFSNFVVCVCVCVFAAGITDTVQYRCEKKQPAVTSEDVVHVLGEIMEGGASMQMDEDVDAGDDSNSSDSEDEQSQQNLLQPRSYSTFYRRILKGQRIRFRPPEKHCDACRQLPALRQEHASICSALANNGDLTAWGDWDKAETRRKAIDAKLPKLLQHVKWLETQRQQVSHINTPH